MADAGYIIQQLDTSNYSLLIPLMKDSFGMDVSAAYFKWKYFENPAGQCIGFLAIEKNTNNCVSFYGAIPQKYEVNGQETTIYQACDTMTHTQHRKKSLYPILARECYEYLRNQNNFLMIGIGGSVQSFPVLKHFGWKIIFYFKNYFKPNILCKLYFLKKYPSNRFDLPDSWDLLAKIIPLQTSSFEIRSPRNLAHYTWRINNPNFNYKIVSYRTKDIISGFVIYYVHQNKIILFDFLFADEGTGRALIWYLSRMAAKNNHKGIISFCQEGGFQSRQLKRRGFVSNPFKKGPLSEKSPFLIYGDEPGMTKISDPGKWFITSYDYDAL